MFDSLTEIYDSEIREAEKDLKESTTTIRTDLLQKIVDAIPRHTKWIEREDGTLGCTQCWYKIPITYGKDFKFCPKCGWVIDRKGNEE